MSEGLGRFSQSLGPTDEPWPGLANLSESIFASMGAAGFRNAFNVERSHSTCLLLIDGLSWNLLEAHAHRAPFLASLMQAKRTFRVGFPATTAASLSSLTSGHASGAHGIVGCSFALDANTVFAPLVWQTGTRNTGIRATAAPGAREFIKQKTAWERAHEGGIAVSSVIDGRFAGSSFSQAIYKAGSVMAALNFRDFPGLIAGALKSELPAFCYAYYSDLDFCGHRYGPGSERWLRQLEVVDRLALSISQSLPRETAMVIVADHGMVTLAKEATHDFDKDTALQEGVIGLYGDVRARHVYTASDQEHAVRERWQNRLGDDFWVLSKAEAIAAKWFGSGVESDAEARIGDLVVIPTGRGGVIRSRMEKVQSAWIGHHGALTDEDQVVPLLVCSGQAM
ncbi:alkaline phosphatase family protein [Pseudomonas akapageensis]|uniref:alkaline phosphatase family protein n=1 Tax=Pseudomonas akapageensis TaxID=2609961 RepID=UPI00140E388C|nr:nucleotide pyrophosphatase/phosphodiesterase family protein [Pseudomonas akapageensis]